MCFDKRCRNYLNGTYCVREAYCPLHDSWSARTKAWWTDTTPYYEHEVFWAWMERLFWFIIGVVMLATIWVLR